MSVAVKKNVGADPATCPHPSQRLYSWIVNDALGKSQCVCCCDCGKSWERDLK